MSGRRGQGDRLRIEVGQRLRASVRPEDGVVRIGRDEFVVPALDIPSDGQAIQWAERLQAGLSRPWHVEGKVIPPRVSVGIALTADSEMSVDEWLRRSDLAMYSAKGALNRSLALFDQQLDEQAHRETLIRRQLESLLAADQLRVDYQPIVGLESGWPIGFGALARLPVEGGGGISLADFIPVAESSGLIHGIGAIVLGHCLAALRGAESVGANRSMSINVSPLQISQEGLAARGIQMAVKQQVLLSPLVLEVTESPLMDRS